VSSDALRSSPDGERYQFFAIQQLVDYLPNGKLVQLEVSAVGNNKTRPTRGQTVAIIDALRVTNIFKYQNCKKIKVNVRFIYEAPKLPHMPPRQRCRHRQSQRTA